MNDSYQLKTASEIKTFVLAGKAIFTLVEETENCRYTYKITNSPDGNAWFVSLLVGPDNGSGYQYICYFNKDLKVKTSRKSRLKLTDKPMKLFKHFMDNIDYQPLFLKFYHEGKCARCGRRLTVPESIESGFGPECIKYYYEKDGRYEKAMCV